MDPVLVSAGADGITTVTLNRPDALNAVDHALTCALASALRAVRADRSCRVVVLTGAGRAFSAGYDLVDYGDDREVTDGVMLGRLHRQQAIAELICGLHELPQPVIAAVNGPAMGAGLAFACASDIRIASRDALFAVAFITAGCSAGQVIANPPASVALTKTGMWTALETPSLRSAIEFENRQQMVASMTADAAEAAAAFLEKRPPRYRGR